MIYLLWSRLKSSCFLKGMESNAPEALIPCPCFHGHTCDGGSSFQRVGFQNVTVGSILSVNLRMISSWRPWGPSWRALPSGLSGPTLSGPEPRRMVSTGVRGPEGTLAWKASLTVSITYWGCGRSPWSPLGSSGGVSDLDLQEKNKHARNSLQVTELHT